MPDKKPSPLAASLLAGLAQENHDIDQVDERQMQRALAVDAEDLLIPPDQDADTGNDVGEGDDDDD